MLSRFLRFGQVNAWAPTETGDMHLNRFHTYLREQVMLQNAAEIARATARSWNRAVDTVPGWPPYKLTVPASKREPYWVKSQDWPESLQVEVDGYLKRLGNPTRSRFVRATRSLRSSNTA